MQNPIPKMGLVQGQRCERCIARFERWREDQRRKRRRGPRWCMIPGLVCLWWSTMHCAPWKPLASAPWFQGFALKIQNASTCVWITWLGFNPQGHQFHPDSQERQEWSGRGKKTRSWNARHKRQRHNFMPGWKTHTGNTRKRSEMPQSGVLAGPPKGPKRGRSERRRRKRRPRQQKGAVPETNPLPNLSAPRRPGPELQRRQTLPT